MMNAKKPRSIGAWVAALFALIPLALSIAGIVFGARLASESRRMQDGITVPATIDAVRLDENRGDDSTTYAVEASYRYVVDGREYTGTRVGIMRGHDNIGTWQQDRFRELEAARVAGRTVTCYVDPLDPSIAVLFPAMRGDLGFFYSIFVAVFGLAGAGIVAGSLRSVARERRAAGRSVEYPDEPWRWRDEWATGVIPSTSRAVAAGLVFFAVVWNAISWSFLILGRTQLHGIAWVVLLFPVLGLGLAAWAILEIRRARRFGGALFHLATQPGRIGGRLAGVVQLPAMALHAETVEFHLRCTETRRSGKNTTTSTRWETTSDQPATDVPSNIDGIAFPVSFDIPSDLPPSTLGGGYPRHEWTLTVKASQPGLDVHVPFRVPVL